MSQFCGSLSGLRSRSGVTSAANAGDASMLAASRALRIERLCPVIMSSHLRIRACSQHELRTTLNLSRSINIVDDGHPIRIDSYFGDLGGNAPRTEVDDRHVIDAGIGNEHFFSIRSPGN